MARLGPAQWTLAEVAAEAGVTAGALVQRFGSKRSLLIALAADWAAGSETFFAELRAAHPSPLAALRAYAECLSQMGATPAALAHHLSYLQLDLADPELRKYLSAHARTARLWIRQLLDEAVATGELVAREGEPPDTASLARAVEVALSGSLMTWAFHQEGTAAEWLAHDLEAVLCPFFAGQKRRR